MLLSKTAYVTLLFLLTALTSFSQDALPIKRQQSAVRTDQKIIIDGDINDSAWKKATYFSDFIEWQPSFGNKEDVNNKTEFYLLYDDEAIYIAGFLHETNNDSISKELVGRDVLGVNDYAGILFDTYNDGINGFGYYVTPLGEQFDAKYSSTGEDANWNSVYETKVKIIPGGWTFEMKIPYAAIRFTKKHEQAWGVQLVRKRTKAGKRFTWNPFDPVGASNVFAQAGYLTKLMDIKPPVRLSFSPYLSTYVNHFPSNDPAIKSWTSSFNAGMDIKYGLNQSFTLDMTLIPDFGQVQSDNQILNLTPFEVKYNEYRTFFTEGTELFSKGNLFYSRRIGGTPLHYDDIEDHLNDNEKVINNPTATKLINAVKFSGRTSNGLGIGFLNAVTGAQYATIEDTVTKRTRNYEVSPVTNYNIFVLDQSLKNNSSVSFINTNTMRNGADYDANVMAGLWDLYNKRNIYRFYGQAGISQLFNYENNGQTQTGYSHSITFAKAGGNFNFNIFQNLTNDKYSQNDMGYATNNNFLDNGLFIGYRWLKPTNFYNNLYYTFNFLYSRRYKPGDFQYADFNTSVNGQLRNLWDFNLYFDIITNQNDFYEPRVDGRVYKTPFSYVGDIYFNTNPAKKYYASLEMAYRYLPAFNGNYADITPTNQIRFNKKLTISLTDYLQLRFNNVGYAFDSTDTASNTSLVYFGKRDRISLENILTIKYNFTNTMGLSFRLRHYWNKLEYKSFYLLNEDGTLSHSNVTYENKNVNYFNIDMLYTWQFAPGSFLNFSWKNAVSAVDDIVVKDYLKNLADTWSSPQNNNISLQIIYYIDYASYARRRKVAG
ncbi:DUF5916 domain-containing protein [Ferruginibacter albus]|uniref:DUF5916 domain-containing protein n=1 Tax=Ferruginibacter albus TaxID=2875540 RepID=UPI001CC5B1D5|nr:DUF5916 domain-containing protein [Ferruginibacter albus]UAY50646.1 carbohydrate binding family 9 domain-containing protein [Ferruginibacter albus]